MFKINVLMVYISYIHLYYGMFIHQFFSFLDLGPAYDLSRVKKVKLRVIQETFLSIESDVQDGYLTT